MRVGMSGHQDIPPEAIAYVKNGIMDIISESNGHLVGVSALAAGADQLFASLVLERGGNIHVIIPCRDYETTFTVSADLDRFRLLISKAQKVTTLNNSEPSEDAYLEAGQWVVDNSDFLIAVWDGQPARGKGGTADVVQYAVCRGVEVKVIWPPSTTR